MTNDHPTYPNPIITEALCEIHFSLPDGTAWKPAFFGELFKQLGPEFPDFEPVTQMGLQLILGPGGGQAVLPSQQRMRYRHASRHLLLQFSEKTLTVNILPKYEGWAQMRTDILQGWEKARAVINPPRITRVGLRYINHIERASADDQPGAWLASSIYVPQAVLASLPGFLLRLETHLNDQNRLIVTVAETPTEREGNVPGIVFDIDRIVEKEIVPDLHQLGNEVDQLHKAVWQVFSASLTPRLLQRLQGG
jgi:uncharacterized protein (TIGR04255 family)